MHCNQNNKHVQQQLICTPLLMFDVTFIIMFIISVTYQTP